MKAFSLLFALSFALSAQAFRFSPMVITFSPKGAGMNQVLTLENPGAEKIAVELEAFLRSHDIKGQEKREKTKDFVIYPEQVALMPKEKRNVRVTWAGETPVDRELSYRIVATQLPVGFKERNAEAAQARASLNIMLQYVASAYVAAPGAKSDVVVDSFKVAPNGSAVLRLSNKGGAHQLLLKTRLRVKSVAGQVLAEWNERPELESVNLLAGESREIDIAEAKPLKAGDYAADLRFEDIAR